MPQNLFLFINRGCAGYGPISLSTRECSVTPDAFGLGSGDRGSMLSPGVDVRAGASSLLGGLPAGLAEVDGLVMSAEPVRENCWLGVLAQWI
jgi:hypothetical protein